MDNWQLLQEKSPFPINSNEESYRAKNIIYNVRVIQQALVMSETNKERELLIESLQRFCDFSETHYSDFLNLIEDGIKKSESKKRKIIATDLDKLFS